MPELTTFVYSWIILGLLLIFVDIFVPTGGVAFFLGLGSLLNSYLVYSGVYDSLWKVLAGWVMISTLMLVFIGGVLMKFVEKRRTKDTVTDKEDYAGTFVEVLETIEPGQKGRVKHQGVGWTAFCESETINAGEQAVIVSRHNTTLEVKKAT